MNHKDIGIGLGFSDNVGEYVAFFVDVEVADRVAASTLG